MTLKEQACQFTVCPEAAVLEAPGCSTGGRGLVHLQCSLSVPTTTRNPPTGVECEYQPPTRVQGSSMRNGAVDDDRSNSTSSAADIPVDESVQECRVWRVLPARIAISLRLERLTPSRPPRPSRAPSVAPIDSLCRLRLTILGVEELIRTFHPGSLLPRHSLSETFTVMVGWNGYDETTGPPLEWPVKVPSICDIPAQYLDLGTGVLLAVPRDRRSSLVLTLRVLPSKRGMHIIPSKGGAETAASVSIDWDGLACLPTCATDYYVETSAVRKLTLQPATTLDLELLTGNSSYFSSAAGVSAQGSRIFGEKTASGTAQLPTTDTNSKPRNFGSCRQTAGLRVRVRIQLETSPVSAPHVLSLSPVAARGPAEVYNADPYSPSRAEQPAYRNLSPNEVSLGDFRDPCRRQRIPYLRFSWPWDDYWLALTERRSSLVPNKPWHLGSRHAVTWARTTMSKQAATNTSVSEGEVSSRLPLNLSGLDGSVAWPGCQELRKVNHKEDCRSCSADSSLGFAGRRVGSRRPKQNYPPPPVLFVEAYDMGLYAPTEQRAVVAVQRVWRRAIDANRKSREWWEYYAMVDKQNAAVCVQAHYRGWRGRQRAQVVKRKVAVRHAAAAVTQRRWR